MRCEVCGLEIYGQPYYRIIEGGRMTVCSRCSNFGSGSWDPKKPQAIPRRRSARVSSRPRSRSEIDVAEQLELVDNYGMLIKKTRQKKGMTIEDFAKKISEKESVIKNLEKGQFNPPTSLVKKLERELGIKLMEVSTITNTQVLTRPIGARTLGDMIKIKTPKDEEEEA
jgi:putative transcription factor